jgi:hypothetical protein
VTGSVDLKPRDYAELYSKICLIAGVTPGEVAGPLTTIPLELAVVLHSPDTGSDPEDDRGARRPLHPARLLRARPASATRSP